MKKYQVNEMEQLELLRVKEGEKRVPAKRVDIVSLRMVKETSLLYKNRHIRSPKDSYELIRTFIEDADREMFISMSLDTKNQPTNIQCVTLAV
jgi:DNA repair protein RadC